MKLYTNKQYIEDVEYVGGLDLTWDKLKGRRLLLSGATGMIGSFLVDVLMDKNTRHDLNCVIYALGRNEERARVRFAEYWGSSNFLFIPCDIGKSSPPDSLGTTDYVLHLASNTHPVQYSTDPIGTIVTNMMGLQNILEFSAAHRTARVLFASSNEIYGENRGDADQFEETYCGYIDCNTLRAGYPESKRCGEALCQAHRKQMGLDVVIPRLTRTYGPTMLPTDTKAISQFILKGVAKEDIVLKSAGKQFYSYTYVADAVAGILTVLLCGKDGEAYNIADESSDITLKHLAELVAARSGKKVVYEIPDAIESLGYSKATKALLDGSKLRQLGWAPKYDIKAGIERTIRILGEIWGNR